MAQYRSKITGQIFNDQSFPLGDPSILQDTTRFERVDQPISEPEIIKANTQANALVGGAGSTPQQTQEATSWLRQTNPNAYDNLAYGTKQISGIDINTLKGKSPNELTEAESYQVAYSRNPELFKQIEALSNTEGKPMTAYQHMMPDSNTAGYFARAFESRPNYVNPNNPYEADQQPWVRQNVGPVAGLVAAATGIGAPLAGALAGTGTAMAIGGVKAGVEALPWSLGAAYGADALASKGVFGGQIQDYQGSRVFGAGGNLNEIKQTPQTGVSPSGTQVAGGSTGPFSETKINGGVTNAIDKLQLPSGGENLGLTIKDPEVAKLIGNTSGMTGGEILNKVITSTKDKSLLQNIVSAFQGGNIIEGLSQIASSKVGQSVLAGLASKFLTGSEPTQAELNTGGVNILNEFVNRLDPNYYGMTQEEKDYLFDQNIGKIQSALARKGLTKGAAEVQATSDLIKAIEMEDLNNRRNLANSAWNNFLNFLNGKEAQSRQDYLIDLQNYENRTSAINDRISKIIELISPEKSYNEILGEYPMLIVKR